MFYKTDKELFEGFEDTANKIIQLKHLADIYNKKFNCRIFSNLLFKDLSLLNFFIELTKNVKINWRSSFDLDGRFNLNKEIDLYINNLYEMSNKLRKKPKIKTTISKQTIKNFDNNSYVFKTFLNLIKDFKITINKYETVGEITDYEKRLYYITNDEFIEWINTTFSNSLKNFIIKPLNDNSKNIDFGLIVNNSFSIKNYEFRKNLKKFKILNAF